MVKRFPDKNKILSKLDFRVFYKSEIKKLSSPDKNGQAKGLCPFHKDSNPSLSVNLNNGLFNCFGCDAKGSVFDFYMKKNGVDFKTAKLRLAEIAGISIQDDRKPKNKNLGDPENIYNYTDEKGNLLFQVCRFKPKTFRQPRPNRSKKGQWIWNLKGVEKVPYRLPQIIQAKTVFLTEGEKDADLLVKLGLTASCNPMGAGKWRDIYNQYFENKQIIILPDNDDQGRKHANQVAKSLYEVAEIIKVVELPGLPKKGDVSDWIKSGHTKDELLSIVKTTAEWESSQKGQDETEERPSSGSDEFFVGNKFIPTAVINSIIQRHDVFHDGSGFFFYVQKRGVWLAQHDNFVGKIIKTMLENKSRRFYVQDVKKQLEWETFLTPDDLRQNRKLINLSNGMLDLQNGKLVPHKKEYYSKIQIPIEFNPTAECTRFMQFLEEIFQDDLEKIDALQDFSGYCLYPEIFIHEALFLIGSGANGKSVCINIIRKVIGRENVSALEPHQLSKKFLLGSLKDKLLNVSSEIQTKSQIDSSILKQVVSGDLVQADIKYKEPFTFRPIAKHIFSMNETPIITDRTYAMKRRLIILKFEQTFCGTKEDKHLEGKLSDELPGILNWCLVGLSRVFKNKAITKSKQMKEDKKAFMRAINPVLTFVDEFCILDKEALVGKDELYQAYKEYSEDSRLRSLSRPKFYDHLLRDYPTIKESRPDAGKRFFKGIGLLIG